jgi:hypothetical protein
MKENIAMQGRAKAIRNEDEIPSEPVYQGRNHENATGDWDNQRVAGRRRLSNDL